MLENTNLKYEKIITTTIIVVIVITTLTTYFYRNNLKFKDENNVSTSSIYTNQNLGISFAYPNSWQVIENSTTHNIVVTPWHTNDRQFSSEEGILSEIIIAEALPQNSKDKSEHSQLFSNSYLSGTQSEYIDDFSGEQKNSNNHHRTIR